MDKTGKRKRGRRIPEILSATELTELLKQPHVRYPTGMRNRTMLQLMADAGLRCSEIINLRPSDIKWPGERVVIVDSKGDDRSVPLSEEVMNWLRRWKAIRPKAKTFFCTLDGKPLDDRYIRRMTKRLAQKAKVSVDTHPHSLRHTFASNIYRQTKDLRLVQQLLGHRSIATTQIYLTVADADKEAAIRNLWSERRKAEEQERGKAEHH